jgi:transcriptional regulator with XRE-family HTH domain
VRSEAQRRELADFLRTRRAKLEPEDVGISFGGRRRAGGLRREDLAQLAGISVTWYTWLEQARPINVSPSVAESLARALQLTEAEREYLLNLAGYQVAEKPMKVVSDSASIHLLVENLGTPALLLNYRWDILAWNHLSSAIFGDLAGLEPRNRNVVRLLYEFPHLMPVTLQEQDGARPLLRHFRAQITQYISRPDIQGLLSELLDCSEPFRTWWSAHDVDKTAVSRIGFVHPQTGPVELLMSSLAAAEGLGLQLYVPSSARDARKLKEMADASLQSATLVEEFRRGA